MPHALSALETASRVRYGRYRHRDDFQTERIDVQMAGMKGSLLSSAIGVIALDMQEQEGVHAAGPGDLAFYDLLRRCSHEKF